MASKESAKLPLIPAFLALLVLIIVGYLIYSDSQPTRTEHTLNPPIEIITPKEEMPLTPFENSVVVPSSTELVQEEAKLFVEKLSPKADTPVVLNEHEDQFVRHDSLISLEDNESRVTTLQSLLVDEDLVSDATITLDYTSKTSNETTLSALSDMIDDHTAPITIVTADGEKLTAPLTDILQNRLDLYETVTLITEKKSRVETSAEGLINLDLNPSQAVMATIKHSTQELSIQDILPDDAAPSDNALFYLHRVTERDIQGLWGIIQAGLINKFRQGLSLEGISQSQDSIQTVIPENADEKLSSGLSSFLGQILSRKVDTSYIYNLKTKGMGTDANVVHPGQQLVLIQFSPLELKQIYQFFSEERNQGIETFAITD